jgi:hypothetical protein
MREKRLLPFCFVYSVTGYNCHLLTNIDELFPSEHNDISQRQRVLNHSCTEEAILDSSGNTRQNIHSLRRPDCVQESYI